jgi:hypothetical protein
LLGGYFADKYGRALPDLETDVDDENADDPDEWRDYSDGDDEDAEKDE